MNLCGRYREFESEYFRLLSDRSNRSVSARNVNVGLERQSGKIDLTNLTYRSQQDMKDLFLRRVLQMETLLQEAGVPNIEFPSGNLYRSLIKYDTDTFQHPAITLLNRMMFNVDPAREGLQAFNFGGSSLLQADILENISSMSTANVQAGKKILTFDTETTGVMSDSQVRQFAYQIEETTPDGSRILIDPVTGNRAAQGTEAMQVASFRNPQMNLARASISGQSMPLSDFVATLEGRTNIEMGEGGINFVSEAKKMMTTMLNVDHIAGHNVLFDVNALGNTLESLDSFHEDSEAVDLLGQLYGKIREKGFLIDTQETMRSYLYEKASVKFQGDSDKASKFVSQLLGPETMASIGIGGSTAPVSVENIALNTNIFQLIEQEDQELAQQMAKRLREGSHIADTDVALQASMDRYRRAGKLDFRFDAGGIPIGGPLSDFEKFARNQVFKSGAINPTTNLASVRHISNTVFDYVRSEEGLQRLKITTTGSALGLSDDAEGILSFSRSQDAYLFRRFGSDQTEVIDQATAKSHITRTLNDARMQGEGARSQIRVGSRLVDVTRNIADEQIISLGFNYIQNTGIDEVTRAKAITAGISNPNLGNEDIFIRALGLTTEQFGERRSIRDIMGLASGRQDIVQQIRNPIDMKRETIDSYYMNAAKAGLPFHNINVADRALSVGIAQATYKVAMNAPSVTYAQNADLLSEMGISFFKMQDMARMGATTSTEDLIPPSRVMMPFANIFEIGTSTIGENVATSNLVVRAFGTGEDIMSTDLNRFTLSYVSGSGEIGQEMPARVNLVWGANKSLSEEQSKKFAEFAFNNAEEFRDIISELDNVDEILDVSKAATSRELLTTGQKYASASNAQKQNLIEQLARHIRDRGVVIGYVEGDAAEGVRQATLSRGIDITGNDVRALNASMRIAHADKESGILVMSAISDEVQDEATRRTSQVAQQETQQAFQSYQRANEILSDKNNRRRAKRVIQASRAASAEDEAVDLTTDVRRDFLTPIADFYIKNKTKIGFAALGMAAVGVGYYIGKKNRESDLYNQTMEAQPVEPSSSSRRSSVQFGASYNQSTRRDPLSTAGVVGNMDRSKIGHSKMGPNKYNHLYGG